MPSAARTALCSATLVETKSLVPLLYVSLLDTRCMFNIEFRGARGYVA